MLFDQRGREKAPGALGLVVVHIRKGWGGGGGEHGLFFLVGTFWDRAGNRAGRPECPDMATRGRGEEGRGMRGG